jgi:excisionase family DNA binding protein
MSEANMNDQTGNDDLLWDANDVARYLKASRSWVYHRAEAGVLPCVRLGGLLRFDPRAIRSLVLGGRTGAPARKVIPFARKTAG